MYHMYVDSYNAVEAVEFRNSIEQFKTEHPDLDFQVEQVASDIYVTKLQTVAASDDLPNIFCTLSSHQQTFSTSGQILSLNTYLDAEPDWKDSFVGGAFDDQTIGDQVYGIPFENLLCHVLYWNRDIFEKCGITSFPTSMEEFKEAVQKLLDKGYTPIAIGNKAKAPLSSVVAPGVVFRYVSKDWYQDLKNGGTAKFTDSEYIEAVEALGSLIDMGAFNADMNSLDGSPMARAQYYYTGKAAMHIDGSWSVSSMINECPKEILDVTEIATIPGPADKSQYAKQIPSGTGWGWSVASKASDEQISASVEFLKLITSKETHQKIIDGGSISAVNVEPTAGADLHPLFLKFLALRSDSELVPTPEIQLSSVYVDASYTGYQDFSIGTLTAEQLAQKLQKALEP